MSLFLRGCYVFSVACLPFQTNWSHGRLGKVKHKWGIWPPATLRPGWLTNRNYQTRTREIAAKAYVALFTGQEPDNHGSHRICLIWSYGFTFVNIIANLFPASLGGGHWVLGLVFFVKQTATWVGILQGLHRLA